MRLQVSDEVIGRTIKCPFEFLCLSGEGYPLCEVTRYIEGNGVWISPAVTFLCRYKLHFGFEYVCTCPTRVEIYHLYRQ